MENMKDEQSKKVTIGYGHDSFFEGELADAKKELEEELADAKKELEEAKANYDKLKLTSDGNQNYTDLTKIEKLNEDYKEKHGLSDIILVKEKFELLKDKKDTLEDLMKEIEVSLPRFKSIQNLSLKEKLASIKCTEDFMEEFVLKTKLMLKEEEEEEEEEEEKTFQMFHDKATEGLSKPSNTFNRENGSGWVENLSKSRKGYFLANIDRVTKDILPFFEDLDKEKPENKIDVIMPVLNELEDDPTKSKESLKYHTSFRRGSDEDWGKCLDKNNKRKVFTAEGKHVDFDFIQKKVYAIDERKIKNITATLGDLKIKLFKELHILNEVQTKVDDLEKAVKSKEGALKNILECKF